MRSDPERRLQELEEEVKRLQRETTRQIAKLQILNEIGRAINAVLDLDRLFELICELTTDRLDCELGSIMLVEDGELVMKAARGIPPDVARKIRMSLGDGIAGLVASTGRPLLVPDIAKDPRLNRDVGAERRRRYAGRSFASVPIMLEERVLGVLNVTNKRAAQELSNEDLEFLETVAAQSAVAIENARLLRQTQLLATTDGVTELYNHRYFQERLAAEVERYRRYKIKHLSVVLFDIDHFKQFNDRFGHRTGDMVLCEVARRIRAQARKMDVCARYGGEEFAVILPESSKHGALSYAWRVREAVETEPFAIGGGLERITVSGGVASCPKDAATAQELIDAADKALYEAKRAGRNLVRSAGLMPKIVRAARPRADASEEE
jgi:diguanylate cyclase (GGDEF)-like protein